MTLSQRLRTCAKHTGLDAVIELLQEAADEIDALQARAQVQATPRGTAVNCPKCNAWTEVLETRKRKAGTYRRYECANLHRFSTVNDGVTRIDDGKLKRGRALPQGIHLTNGD